MDELRAAYQFTGLEHFLPLFQGSAVLRTRADFYDLTLAYLRKAASQHENYAAVRDHLGLDDDALATLAPQQLHRLIHRLRLSGHSGRGRASRLGA